MLPSSPSPSALRGDARGRFWGVLPDGRAVYHWTLRNAGGMRVDVSNLGGALLSWWAPDRNGRMDDILLGHPQPADYLRSRSRPAVVAGPEPTRHTLPVPVWEAAIDGDALLLETSPGDPAAQQPSLRLRVELDDDGALCLDCRAHGSMAFPMDLLWRHHFNLNGGRTDVRGHMLRVAGSRILAPGCGDRGKARRAVAGTAFDFRSPAPLGTRLDWPGGSTNGRFEACYVLGGQPHRLHRAATLADPVSGRLLDVYTDQRGLRLDAGEALSGEVGRDGSTYRHHDGVALNPFALVDGAGMGPDTVRWLHPGQVGTLRTRYRLGIMEGTAL